MSLLQRKLAPSFSPREKEAKRSFRNRNTRDGFPTQLLMIPQEIHLLRDQNTHHRFPTAHPLAISDADAQQKKLLEN